MVVGIKFTMNEDSLSCAHDPSAIVRTSKEACYHGQRIPYHVPMTQQALYLYDVPSRALKLENKLVSGIIRQCTCSINHYFINSEEGIPTTYIARESSPDTGACVTQHARACVHAQQRCDKKYVRYSRTESPTKSSSFNF